MFTRLRQWYSDIPLNDLVARQTALFLQALLLIFISVLLIGIFLPGVPASPPEVKQTTIILDIATIIPLAGLLVLLRRGKWRLAMILFVALDCALVALSLVDNGIQNGWAFSHAVLPVAIVSVLYRRRWTALVVAGVIIAIALTSLGPQAPMRPFRAASTIINYAAVAILLAVFLTMIGETYRLVVANWRSQTETLQKEVTRRKKIEAELEDHRARLEQTVETRTADLQAANEQLQALGRAKDEFVANVSHELRTPLTSMKLFERLLEGRAGPEMEVTLMSLRRETGRLEHLVESLLLLSRLDANQVMLDLVDVDLNPLIESLLSDRAPMAEDRKLNLETSLVSGLPPVKGDPRLLEQVLSILLTNAFNYTPPGGVVRVVTHLEDNSIRWAGFTVKDTGPGIPLDEQEQLFKRFFRGNSGRRSQVSGTGLGLAIAHEIVERHAGQINAESNGVPGEGTAFRVRLPVDTPPG